MQEFILNNVFGMFICIIFGAYSGIVCGRHEVLLFELKELKSSLQKLETKYHDLINKQKQ